MHQTMLKILRASTKKETFKIRFKDGSVTEFQGPDTMFCSGNQIKCRRISDGKEITFSTEDVSKVITT